MTLLRKFRAWTIEPIERRIVCWLLATITRAVKAELDAEERRRSAINRAAVCDLGRKLDAEIAARNRRYFDGYVWRTGR
jgi:hypothetical protein